MCRYCEENKVNTNHNGNELKVYSPGMLSVTMYDDEMYRCATTFPINYCPMCGRKL